MRSSGGLRWRAPRNRVEWLADNAPFCARAGGEVILAAGAINSPKVLELSGIGQASRLASLGVPVIKDVAGVGENLQDHLQIRTVFKVKGTPTLNTMAGSLIGKARIAMKYALTRSGPMSMAPSQFGMFTRSGPDRETPDLEYHVQPLSTDRLGDPLHPFPAITVSSATCAQPQLAAFMRRRRALKCSRKSASTTSPPPRTAALPWRPSGSTADHDRARAEALCPGRMASRTVSHDR